uniref:Tumor necrosis factor ligand superfamily member 13B-like n=2 Tax=Lepisosteus oculatus TaxID=7918 RepID=W5NBW1_LEPOC
MHFCHRLKQSSDLCFRMFELPLRKNSLHRKLLLSHCILLMVVSLTLCLSIFLLHQIFILRDDLEKLSEEIYTHLNQHVSSDLSGQWSVSEKEKKLSSSVSSILHHGKSSKVYHYPVASSFLRTKREQKGFTKQQSFLQLRARTNEKPIHKGNTTIIPWTVAVQRGGALSTTDNKIIVQQDSYYMVYGQVVFLNPGDIMGHLIRRRKSSISGTEQRFTNLLLCIQDMPNKESINSCYTAGVVKLDQEDELELVIPDRPQTQVSMDADSTFFGIIQLS